MSEINCPLKNSWKLRCRSARPATCQRDPRSEAASPPFTVVLASIGVLVSDTLASLDDSNCPLDQYNLNAVRIRNQPDFFVIQRFDGRFGTNIYTPTPLHATNGRRQNTRLIKRNVVSKRMP